jgi:hypothetical protein
MPSCLIRAWRAKLRHCGTARTSHFRLSIIPLLSSPLLYPPPPLFLAHEMRAPAAQERRSTSVGHTGPPAGSTWHPAAIIDSSSSLQLQDKLSLFCFCFYSSNTFRLRRTMVVPPTYLTMPQKCKSPASKLPRDAATSPNSRHDATPCQGTQVHPPYRALQAHSPHCGMQVAALPCHANMGHHATKVCKSCHLMPHHRGMQVLSMPCLAAFCPHPHDQNRSEGRQSFALAFTGTHCFFFSFSC